MLGLGFGEIFVVAIVLLVAVGPKRLPTLMRAVGKALREFRRGAFELRQASGIDRIMNEDMDAIRRPLKEIRPSLQALPQTIDASPEPTSGGENQAPAGEAQTLAGEPGAPAEETRASSEERTAVASAESAEAEGTHVGKGA